MKGRIQIFALLTVLFLFFLSPHFISATQEVREINNISLDSISFADNGSEFLSYKRVLIDEVWWILVYDGLKLIDAYPE